GGSLQVAGGLVPEHERQQEVARLDMRAALGRKQLLRPAEPSSGPAQLAALSEMNADPEGAADRAKRRPRIEMRPVGALERADVVLRVADHVRRGRKQLQILRPQERYLIPSAACSASNASIQALPSQAARPRSNCPVRSTGADYRPYEAAPVSKGASSVQCHRAPRSVTVASTSIRPRALSRWKMDKSRQ